MSKLNIQVADDVIASLEVIWGRLNSAPDFPCSSASCLRARREPAGRAERLLCWTCKAQWHVACAENELRTALQDARAVETVKAHGEGKA